MEEKVKEIAECCICTDLFTDPRMLPCIHTFCLQCLTDASEKAQMKPGDLMPCPICRTQFVIPRDGVSGLQRNFFMESLVEATKISKPSEKTILCQICIEENKTDGGEMPEAKHYCIQCQQLICNKCSRDHKRIKLLEEHQLVLLGSPVKEELVKKLAVRCCDHHKKKEVDMFCFNCKSVICIMCFVEKHKSHECSDIDTVGDKFREEIIADMKQLKSFWKDTSEKIQRIIEKEADFQRKLEVAEKSIIERGKELKEIVDKCTRSLLDELTYVRIQNTKLFEAEKDESERHLTAVETLEQYLRELTAKGAATEICRSVSDVHRRSQDLRTSHRRIIQSQIQSTPVSLNFVASGVDFSREKNIVGSIKVESKEVLLKKEGKEDSVSIRSARQLDLSDSHSVQGATMLENKIYVLCNDPNSIFVFEDDNTVPAPSKIKLTEITKPWDIASCEKSKCLFVSDRDNRCIWRMTVDDHQVTKWISNLSSSFTFSITPDDHLLILRQDEPSHDFSKLQIHGLDGKLVRSLLLRSAVQDPCHCVQKPTGEFIISHFDRPSEQWTISQLSNDARKIIRQFHPKTRSEEMKDPCYLFLDHEKHRLYVADSVDDCVILFDSDSLEFKEVLLTKQNGLRLPFKLFYDTNRMRLIVCQHSRKVDIYEL